MNSQVQVEAQLCLEVRSRKSVCSCVCVVSKCAVIHNPPPTDAHIFLQSCIHTCSHVPTLKRALVAALLFACSSSDTLRNKQEEASAAVVRSRVSHQVSVSAVKPQGQVLGSTLVQKSG